VATEGLFSRAGTAPHGAQVSVGGHLESSESLARAFMKAADALGEAWRGGRVTAPMDQLALPIIQIYRHSIELMLKAGCEKTAQLIGFGCRLGYGDDVRPPDLEDQLGRTHSIAGLVYLLTRLLGGLSGSVAGRLPTETREVLRYLHDLDAHGTAFRYASKRVGQGKTARWEPVRPRVVLLDLDNAITQLHAAAGMLDGGMMTYLDKWLIHLSAGSLKEGSV